MSIITQLMTTIPTHTSLIGTAYGGGYYAGRIKIGTSIYALIVAPKATGQSTGAWKAMATGSAGTQSLNDGLSNSNSMNSYYPASQFCKLLGIGGFNDWYLPSRDELEICYRNLKPNTTANTVYASRLVTFGNNGFNGVDS